MSKIETDKTVVDMGVVNEDEEDAVAPAAPAPAADAVDEDADEIATLPRGAIEQADRSVVVTLDAPVEVRFVSQRRGTSRVERVAELRFHRLNGAQLTEISNAPQHVRERVAMALSARMNKARFNGIYDRMDAADIMRCARVIEYFFGSGRTTGRS